VRQKNLFSRHWHPAALGNEPDVIILKAKTRDAGDAALTGYDLAGKGYTLWPSHAFLQPQKLPSI
jgi:hypothetical protein